MKTCNLLALLLALLAAQARAFTPEEERVERERIQSERAQVEAAYALREQECRERFVVTSCIEDARRDRRQARERLRRQQELLDEAQRKRRAAQRMEDIRNKVSADDGKRRESSVREPRQPRLRDEPARSSPPSAPAAAASQSGDDEARSRAAHARRQAQAQAHREAVERRNAERAAKGKRPAAPLPVPASAPR